MDSVLNSEKNEKTMTIKTNKNINLFQALYKNAKKVFNQNII